MSLEVHQPEIERRVRERIQSGQFQDVDDFLSRALVALSASAGERAGALDWSRCPAVESVPGRVSGAWVFRNTRMPVAAVFENLEDGVTIDELVELYAGLTRDQIKSVLEFAAQSLGHKPLGEHAGGSLKGDSMRPEIQLGLGRIPLKSELEWLLHAVGFPARIIDALRPKVKSPETHFGRESQRPALLG